MAKIYNSRNLSVTDGSFPIFYGLCKATEDPDFFGFYSPDLEGFTGIRHSFEDCLYKARSGMATKK